MSTWKTTPGRAVARRARKKIEIDAVDETEDRPVQDVEAKSLRIDEDYDVECDPYNRTGQFCVPEFDKHDK